MARRRKERIWLRLRNTKQPCGTGFHRTARLEDGKFLIYRIEYIFDEDSRMIMDYQRVFEEEISAAAAGN